MTRVVVQAWLWLHVLHVDVGEGEDSEEDAFAVHCFEEECSPVFVSRSHIQISVASECSEAKEVLVRIGLDGLLNSIVSFHEACQQVLINLSEEDVHVHHDSLRETCLRSER